MALWWRKSARGYCYFTLDPVYYVVQYEIRYEPDSMDTDLEKFPHVISCLEAK